MKTKFISFMLSVIICMMCSSCKYKKNNPSMEQELTHFIAQYEDTVIPLYVELNKKYYEASITGNKEDFDTVNVLEMKLNKIYSNKEAFAQLKKFRESNQIKNYLLKQQLDVLYYAYLSSQTDEKKMNEVITLGNEIQKKFNVFRADINGKKLSDNEIDSILTASRNSAALQEAWLASKEVGAMVVDDIQKIIRLRNEIAHDLGFRNFHDMSLIADEQSPAEIDALFDELDAMTQGTYTSLKSDIDAYLSQLYNIPVNKLMPWHYQNKFFQEAPKIYDIDFDKYYKNEDVVELSRSYYKSIGLTVDSILAHSDLYEKEGKNQHAYCIDIDRSHDVRVLCNVKPNQKWMSTMLHELGHGVYDYYLSDSLPFVLRSPAHTFTTEAIAMLFGRFATEPQWLQDMVHISEQEKQSIAAECDKSLKLEQLIFSRWVQVVYRFEKQMYANPDQDLNKLWWDLVEKYQMIKRPENRNAPDWAAKIHIAAYPCYYHNYMLGELLASQLYFYINHHVIKTESVKGSFANQPAVGEYLRQHIFSAGRYYHWSVMIEKATGEKLTPKYFAEQFLK